MISIVIPTYNENENIKKLIPDLFSNYPDLEVIIVDDNSPDGTSKTARRLAKKYNIKVLTREKRLGLSSAVLLGFKSVSSNILGVMDADLSHPASKVKELIELTKYYDIVIGSRLVQGGKVQKWPLWRKLVSMGATLLTKPLTEIRDPMSGFFFIKKDVIKNRKLSPIGYKILLEILVKGKYKNVVEVPYIFQNRNSGTSKLTLKEYLNYLTHLARLYTYKIKSRN